MKIIAVLVLFLAFILPLYGYGQEGEVDWSILYFAANGDGISAGYDADPFVQEVNAAWIATNYPLIKAAITNRLAENTNSLLALGLLFEYYRAAEVDYLNAKAAAQAFVIAVSNRVPAEIIEERAPMGLPIFISREAIPTNIPANQARPPDKVDYMHSEYSDSFPHMKQYQILDWRIGAIENGTFTWEDGMVDPEE